MNQQCKVCGEPAAGFHFGAFTCEGCKSFFGRSYNNLGSISECKNGGGCIINKKNRTSCKACRLRKCLMVGMSKSGSRYGRRSNWFKIHCLLQEQANNIENQQIHNHVNGHRGSIPGHHHDHHSIHHHHPLGSALTAFPYHHHQVKQVPTPSGTFPHHRPADHEAPGGDLRQRANGESITAHQMLHPHLHPHLLQLHRQRAEEHQQLMMMMMEECHKNGNGSGSDICFGGGTPSRSPSAPLGSPHSRDGDRSPVAEKNPKVPPRLPERLDGHTAVEPAHTAASNTPNGGADLFLRLPFLQAGAFLPTSHFSAAAAAAAVAAAAAAAASSGGGAAPRFKSLFPNEVHSHGHIPSAHRHQHHHIRSKSPTAENHHHEMDVYHKRFYLDSVLRSQRSPSGGSGGDEASTNSSCLSSPGGSTSRPQVGGRCSSGNGSSRCSSPCDQEDPMDLSVKGAMIEKRNSAEGNKGREDDGDMEAEGSDGEEEEGERRRSEDGDAGEWEDGGKEKEGDGENGEDIVEVEGNPLDLSTKDA